MYCLSFSTNKPKAVSREIHHGEGQHVSQSAMQRTSTRHDPSLVLGMRAPTADEALMMNQKFTTTEHALAEIRFVAPMHQSRPQVIPSRKKGFNRPGLSVPRDRQPHKQSLLPATCSLLSSPYCCLISTPVWSQGHV